METNKTAEANKTIYQEHYPTVEVNQKERDIVEIAQNFPVDGLQIIHIDRKHLLEFVNYVYPSIQKELEETKESALNFKKALELLGEDYRETKAKLQEAKGTIDFTIGRLKSWNKSHGELSRISKEIESFLTK